MIFHALEWIYKLYICFAAACFGYGWIVYGWRERTGTGTAVLAAAGKAVLTAAVTGFLIWLFWLH